VTTVERRCVTSTFRGFPGHVAVVVVLGYGVTAPLGAQSAAWHVDTATVTFVVRNAGLPVQGSFDGVQARVCFDPARPVEGTLGGTIDPGTIHTGIDMRDRHLQRHGWFDVPRYGMIEMRSLRLDRAADGYAGTFLLRIRDVEREVKVPFGFERKDAGARIAGTLTIDRLDYGLGKPSVVLSDDVEITVVLDLLPRDPAWDGEACR
jgi:polyisoprenoid-binding protein YceI